MPVSGVALHVALVADELSNRLHDVRHRVGPSGPRIGEDERVQELDLGATIDLSAVPADDVVRGTPSTGSRPLAAVAGAEIGVWEMTEGVATDVEADEVFLVLSGRATVTAQDGTALELGPGSAVRLHAGDRTTWTVHERLRKVYVT